MILKFSAIINVYAGDDANNFSASIESIIHQTLLPDELVLVIDGPISDTLEAVIDKWGYLGPDFFRIIRLKENQGQGNARRIALANARFDYVAVMDADDICMPDRFEYQIKIAKEHPEYSVIGGLIEEYDFKMQNYLGMRKVPETSDEIYRYLRSRCPFNQMTVLFKKKDVEQAGGYLDWHFNEDYFLWIRMALNGCAFYNIQKVLCKVRAGNGMYKRRGGLKYFVSEAKLQSYMHEKGLINFGHLILNVGLRFILQVLLPNQLRGFFYRRFARVK